MRCRRSEKGGVRGCGGGINIGVGMSVVIVEGFGVFFL